MSNLSWVDFEDFEVRAKPLTGIWQATEAYIGGPALIRIEVKSAADAENGIATWKYDGKPSIPPCSADGDWRAPYRLSDCLHPSAPVGSLIGRIGGSTAESEKETVFVVGSLCIRTIDKNTRGLLFLTMNDRRKGFEDNEGSLTVSIRMAPIEVPVS